MNQQEVINLIKTTHSEQIKIAQLNNGIIDIQILPLKQILQSQHTDVFNEILARCNQRPPVSTRGLSI